MSKINMKWKLTLKVLPFIAVILIIKLVAHQFKLEFLTLNSLFSAIISANVFLIGFLISGVLVDYKEAEKWYSHIYSKDKKNKFPYALFYLALMNKSNGDYVNAKNNFSK